jgi:acyl-CoA thioesterase
LVRWPTPATRPPTGCSVALGAVCDAAEGDAAEGDAAEGDATASAFTINYVKVIAPGSTVHIHTRRVGGGRSVSYWQSEVVTEDHSETLATASVVLTKRRDTDGHVDVPMPPAPEPEGLNVFRPPGTFGERTEMLMVEGFPPFARADTRSVHWVRELSGRAVDHCQLAFLSDVRPPRSFYWSDGPRPSATLTLSVYFHATDAELAAVGDDYLLSEAFGVRGAQSTSEEHLRLWSRSGALLASSEQLGWYR